MPIRDEELVQFLLGEADPAMRRRIEHGLATDPQVAQRLQELRAALGLLDSLKSSVEPPEDLVGRTMQRIANDADSPLLDSEQADSQEAGREPVELGRPSNSVPVGSSALQPVPARRLASRANLWDSAILSVSITSLACLLLPLVLQARFDSRRLQCGYHLKVLGEGLTHLAQMDRQRRFPSVPTTGSEAFAGMYALRLQDAGLLPTSAYLKCVSIPSTDGSGPQIICVPSSADFLMADEFQQSLWRVQIGGNYAYCLGVLERGHVVGPHLEGRSHFPILADAPKYQNGREIFEAHEGRGANFYYEDGHVAFGHFATVSRRGGVSEQLSSDDALADAEPLFQADSWSQSIDHPFRNLEGEHAAGLTPDDAALGPSYSTPRPAMIRR